MKQLLTDDNLVALAHKLPVHAALICMRQLLTDDNLVALAHKRLDNANLRRHLGAPNNGREWPLGNINSTYMQMLSDVNKSNSKAIQ